MVPLFADSEKHLMDWVLSEKDIVLDLPEFPYPLPADFAYGEDVMGREIWNHLLISTETPSFTYFQSQLDPLLHAIDYKGRLPKVILIKCNLS